MSTFLQVDPLRFIDVVRGVPATGRGAWTREGIGFEYRYMLSTDPALRIGTLAEKSLAHWAVAAGCWAIQKRLIDLGHMAALSDGEKGIFGPKTVAAVKKFQEGGVDPEGDVELVIDGIVGRSDARALYTPLLDVAEVKYQIPDRLLLGQTYHESRLDPGAVGYYIYYPDYRGVDRGMSQINSRFQEKVTWRQAFDPWFSFDWSAESLRRAYDRFKAQYPTRALSVLWDAALCNHNNPYAASQWAKYGYAPTDLAAAYVNAVKAARY